jgi:hypothetical protein
MKPDDKRTLFPFGYNLMTPLDRLRHEGLTVRYDHESGKLMIGPKELLAKWADFIKEHRDSIIADLDNEQREAAMAKLPFAEFEDGPVQMREVVLLRMFDGEYLAITQQEASTLDGSAAVAKSDSDDGSNTVGPTRSMNAGSDCSELFPEAHSTLRELF